MNKISKHPTLELELSFDEEKHQYHDSNGIRYIGVTTLIHNWFESFDSLGIATKCSQNPNKPEYFGKTPEEIMKEWAANSKKSCDFGTKVHKYCEEHLNGDTITELPFEDDFMHNFLNGFQNEYEIIGTEFLIFSPELRVATMIDVLARHKKTGYVLIGDWKTNKKIDKKSFFNRALGEYKVGLGELDCVMDCNYQHYALQVNLCQEILEREGYFPVDTKFVKKIFHIKEDRRKKQDRFSVETYTIREKRKPVEIMMDKRLAEVALTKISESEEF